MRAYILLDGFGGQAVTLFARKNFARIVLENNWDGAATIDQLDSELRVNCLLRPDYKAMCFVENGRFPDPQGQVRKVGCAGVSGDSENTTANRDY